MKTFSDAIQPPVAAMHRYCLNGQTMGSRYSSVFYAATGIDLSVIGERLFAAVDNVDRRMSNWKPDSELNRLNAAPVGQWQSVSKDLFVVLETALRVGRQSGGAFDIGVGELVQAWGFGPANGRIDEQRIKALKAEVHRPAADIVELDASHRRIRKHAPVTLDLSGIAKGYGVDQLARCLDEFGITRYLVGIDGEMRARGAKPDGNPWAIAIEKPVRDLRDVMGVMELRDAAIATSGDYRHWAERQGKFYAHTMNGARGEPLANQLASVSVVESSCMLADAWATALLVSGEKKGVQMARERGLDALFVVHDGDGFQQMHVESP